MLRRSMFVMLLVLFGSSAKADVMPQRAPSEGELLYTTYCIACHNDQIHWRDKRVVKDWVSLRAEIGRWQKLSKLGWHASEIEAVARYLNTLYYHLPSQD
jgi:mono/diheme cytochrome c family protein